MVVAALSLLAFAALATFRMLNMRCFAFERSMTNLQEQTTLMLVAWILQAVGLAFLMRRAPALLRVSAQ